jgi:hypothetical protein
MLERKSKISAKLYEKDVKTSKETLKTRLKNYFCNGKNKTITLMLERKLKISAMLYKNILKISKEPLKTRLKATFAM